MVRKIVISVILFLFIVTGLCWYFFITPTKDLKNVSIKTTEKPVIVLVIDSLMDQPLQKAIDEGKAPAFEFLMKHGHYHANVISSYPTMSVTIDSTILTGTYADQHKIPGLVWFKQDENRVVNYGPGKIELLNLGAKQVLLDSLILLNKAHLNPNIPTIYEELAKSEIQSASLNGLIYRGDQVHQLHIPKVASTMNLLPHDVKINGPSLLSMGSLSQFNPETNRLNLLWKAMGLNNQFTANELKYFIQEEKMPPFTLAYFPDMDHQIHKSGPKDRKGIEEADKQLQVILNAYPSWEEALKKAVWIVHGDSSQSAIVHEKSKALIDLNKLLSGYTFWKPDEPSNNQVALAVNERMAYIYVSDETIATADILLELKSDSRIGFIAWKKNNTNFVMAKGFDKPLTFSPNGPYTDQYGQSWKLNGDHSILDLSINNQNEINYSDYPDALARLHGALHSHKGRYIIVDAKPGYEFVGKQSPDHAGGAAHGSLHKLDSEVPVMIAGTDQKPKNYRLVDFKDWIVELTK
ncbi:alkaline phosphatase family protein [Domibacillus epiphyticus]|uniref:Phosphodiesterase n=1 Tax=Domibacillus epiphyticus TaxID=1714355 RepID=A0A1V2A8V4_9BACI|nr:alkaline phosphatase family protein [Domibacillus epiphyticus]OMP67360.1 phosphodiesterase [Domibacillus epiphyticus]